MVELACEMGGPEPRGPASAACPPVSARAMDGENLLLVTVEFLRP